jgi:hypothetical protein
LISTRLSRVERISSNMETNAAMGKKAPVRSSSDPHWPGRVVLGRGPGSSLPRRGGPSRHPLSSRRSLRGPVRPLLDCVGVPAAALAQSKIEGGHNGRRCFVRRRQCDTHPRAHSGVSLGRKLHVVRLVDLCGIDHTFSAFCFLPPLPAGVLGLLVDYTRSDLTFTSDGLLGFRQRPGPRRLGRGIRVLGSRSGVRYFRRRLRRYRPCIKLRFRLLRRLRQ